MTPTATKRLSKTDRKVQLLEAALEIVRKSGTEGLTLATVAEKAGVTKPIAYEHFGSRSGLLIELYLNLASQQKQVIDDLLKSNANSLEDAAGILAKAYLRNTVLVVPEICAVEAALVASDAMQKVRLDLKKTYIERMHKVFSQFGRLPKKKAYPHFVALLGAGDALLEEIISGSVSNEAAVSSLKNMIISVIEQIADIKN